MTTVVLGWDGLDADLVEAFDLSSAFGEHERRLSTFDNDALGTPHTYEVWPSIITGRPPEQHGIYAATEGEGVAWDDPLLQRTASLARHVVPKSLRTRTGELLRERGAELDFKTPAYYRERGIDTVFDRRTVRAITVPNYATDRDQSLGLDVDRGAELSEFLSVGGDEGETNHELNVPLPELEERLVEEVAKKTGVVRACLQREYDLVFVWFGYLDTVGHLAPSVDAHGWQERAYRRAARLTDDIRSAMQADDTLVCVSDHGLRDGHHTHDAFLGASNERATDGVRSVLGVRDGIERVTSMTVTGDSLPLRPEYRHGAARATRETVDVRDQLENLGYL
jgi:hypothetical protein